MAARLVEISAGVRLQWRVGPVGATYAAQDDLAAFVRTAS